MPKITCCKCNKLYSVVPALAESSKFCSVKCKWDFNGWSSEDNVICGGCGVGFHLKPSRRKGMKHQPCCSRACLAKYRSVTYSGEKNPNHRGKSLDSDGYRLYVPSCNNFSGSILEKKLHRAVACEVLGVNKIKGFHVHHRDCDVLNNAAENLAVLSTSDHKWLHKQYGNATLWALMRGKIDIEILSSWSDDITRAKRLLCTSILSQKAEEIGTVENRQLIERAE